MEALEANLLALLWKFTVGDKTNKPDYALETAGARIVGTTCDQSPYDNYLSYFFGLGYHPPAAILRVRWCRDRGRMWPKVLFFLLIFPPPIRRTWATASAGLSRAATAAW